MRAGAVGLSSALEYAPAPYAKTEELIALAGEAAKFGGIYATHLRSEGDGIMAALDEAIRIGRSAGIPVEVWHLKVAGRRNFGLMPAVVAKIDAARATGTDVSANTYAYTAWENGLSAFIPPWAHDGGNAKLAARLHDPALRKRIREEILRPSTEWDNEWDEIPGPEAVVVGVVHKAGLLPLQGKTLAEVASKWKKDPIDTLFDLLIEDDALTEVAVFGMSEADVALALEQPWVSVDNDSPGTSPQGILGQQVRKGGAQAHTRGRGAQIHRVARSAHAPHGSRRAQAGGVGRPRDLRSDNRPRHGDLRVPQQPVAGHGVRTGQRRTGH